MKFLLDTHLLLWAAGQPERLSAATRQLLNNPKHDFFFSAASLWEIAIKKALGRPDFRVDLRQLRRGLLENGYVEMPIISEHTLDLEWLPPHHKDPFDRLLLAQARSEGITLVTSDEVVAGYPGPVRKV